MIDQVKQRAAGLVLLVLLLLAALPGLLILPVLIGFGPISWARAGLTALDLLGNATVFRGSPYETISGHTGRELLQGTWWARILSGALDLIQPGHCLGAMAQEAKLQKAIQQAND